MIILMADIVGSSKRKGNPLMTDFKNAVAFVNKMDNQHINSPLTITLGDEFQGVAKSVYGAFRIIFDLEIYLLTLKRPFQLRYVVQEGEIETKINKKIAYEMLGSGLTHARENLNYLKASKNRFSISLEDRLMTHKLMLAINVYQGIVDRWTTAQRSIAIHLLTESDYKKTAKKLKKEPTLIWKRRRSLMIDEVNNMKKLILLIIDPKWKF